jgi:HD-like signal output (HDOD) protein
MTILASPFITRAPRDVAAWAARFDVATLPILADTADAIALMAENEDAVDAHMLSEVLANDPLMTLKLLAHVARLRRGRDGSEPETVTEALVMLGIPPFFRAFGDSLIAEDRLADHPEALEGLRRVLQRSHRAALFATSFAVHRMDHDVSVIHEAALLHDFTEVLVWLHAPELALEVARRQQHDPTLRSADVQRAVLNISLTELQQVLMKGWHLPSLLVSISDDVQGNFPQVRNVQLAIRVARHSALGWDNAALPDDLCDIADLLQLGIEPTRRLLLEIDAG